MFNPNEFTIQKPKPLPVLFLLDRSGSMDGENIQSLNQAVYSMLQTFSQSESIGVEIQCGIVSFGDRVTQDIPLTTVRDIFFKPLVANGLTPMGEALGFMKNIIENKEIISSRAYRPIVILLSDGAPTDSWQQPMADFVSQGRSAKCFRMAMGIGAEASMEPLHEFIKGTDQKVFTAHDAKDIHKFFQFVTMSVVSRSKSQDPNAAAPISISSGSKYSTEF